jgi:hypothetical protein
MFLVKSIAMCKDKSDRSRVVQMAEGRVMVSFHGTQQRIVGLGVEDIGPTAELGHGVRFSERIPSYTVFIQGGNMGGK